MQKQKFLIRRVKCRMLLLAVTALTMPFSVLGQSANITLPLKELTAQEVFNSIQEQTNYKVAVNKSKFDTNLSVKITKSPVTVMSVLNTLLAGTGMTYALDGNYIIIPVEATESGAVLPAFGAISGVVADAASRTAISGVEVSVVGTRHRVKSDDSGRFEIRNIPEGGYAVKFYIPQNDTTVYRDMLVQPNKVSDNDIYITFDKPVISKYDTEATAIITPEVIAERKRQMESLPSAKTVMSESEHTYMLVNPNNAVKSYRPRIAVKTNLLYLATTTPNLAIEFSMAPKWTFNLAMGLNPWDLNERKGGIRHGLVQPEVRYWFCNSFERHFIGLHGIFGQYQVMDIKIPLIKDMTGVRYQGWCAGAGIAYGYHLPLAPRWAMEFSLGAGWVYFDYKKYDCGDCDSFMGRNGKHYFGPTKASVSMIFLIK